MNSRWQASKVGFVNFWYYDEQEFPFAKGRILLRGSNGSGKSVTMQSVVPLLLDGDISPERLDPFGTRDRKISGYLLEEDDDREERTGYIYLEFRRRESDAYLTVGMGLRARKGKKLEKWYFSIADGRRIGKDFFLYRQTEEKIPLSKKELENRLAEGGTVFERQSEYMEYVNRQVFGFESTEEYKEMIDLLIQLRTPKLSKEFKPSVINEILSNSLPPLSDEDLRPMSEAIENMDTMNMNLKSREAAKQAAEKINRVFERYNRFILYKKADAYCQTEKKVTTLSSEAEEKEKQLQASEQEVKRLEQELTEMEAKNSSLQKERDSLNKSDALNLKTRENELEQEMQAGQRTITDKERFLAAKQDQYVGVQEQKKKAEDRKYEKECEIKERLEQMQEEADDMAFEEHAFFCSELLQELEAEYSFSVLQNRFEETKDKIEQTLHILEETNLLDRQADDLTKRWERAGKEADTAQRKQLEAEMLFVQTQNEWKERLYQWNGNNQELLVEKDILNRISRFADDYNDNSDFAQIRKTISELFFNVQMNLKEKLHVRRRECEEIEQKQKEKQEELAEWEKKKEMQPPRSEAVCSNRKRLDELGIPYQEFYKVIEFGKELNEEAQNRLEEALLHMGILDAVIVDEQYKEQVLAPAAGCEDTYLFTNEKRAAHSLLDVLRLNQEVNDIFSNQRITELLSNIAYGEDGVISITSGGVYRMGVVTGTITGEHTAQFMGTKAREQARLLRIEECRACLLALEKDRTECIGACELLEKKMERLQAEYDALPQDEDMREAWKLWENICLQQERLRQEQTRLEGELRELKDTIGCQKEKALLLAKGLYLDCTYTVFVRAAKAADAYKEHLTELISAHEIFRHSVQTVAGLLEQMTNLDDDMEQLRYDIMTAQRKCEKLRQELISVQQQLALTDYDEIRERLDACVKWLTEYPAKLSQCVTEKTEQSERIKALAYQLENCRRQREEYEERQKYLEQCFEMEYALGYVKVPKEFGDTPDQICSYLAGEAKEWNRDDIISRLNQVYFENRAYLNDYQLTQTELFQEMDGEEKFPEFSAKRLDIFARYKGMKIPFVLLLGHLEEDIVSLQDLIRASDRELFEDILANTVSRKIRSRIHASTSWVDKMNGLMNSMNTSSGLKLSLRWRSKVAETEDQLDTKELVGLLKKDYRLMTEEEVAKLSAHFRSKVAQARRHTKDNEGMISFYQMMKNTLDYRKWFEFQLFSEKAGERQKELTNSVFGTFSGGEKAMAMYVPLFSALAAKYQSGRQDALRLISLDEAFAGVDKQNIRDMFRLMTEFSFDFVINSQVLWGDCDTLDALAIYQLYRPKNAKFVAVMPYLWNGKVKEVLENEEMVEKRSAELEPRG